MRVYADMARVVSAIVGCLCLAALGRPAFASDATLFRLFLRDGSGLVSYGEFARVDDRVVFSMPVGKSEEPRLQVASVRAALVDWPRTERYSASARYQRYAQTRGEDDFRTLSNQVALALNDVALSSNRQQALALAEKVRRDVAEWPQLHYGYRSNDIREIVAVLDEAISSLRASTGSGAAFELALVATSEAPPLEPVLGMPTPREQFDSIMHLANISTSTDRVALLQAAMGLVSGSRAVVVGSEAAALKRAVERDLRGELSTDRQYTALSQRVVSQATEYAARAAINDIERLIAKIPKEDAKLGQKRPDVMQSVTSAVQTQLIAARRLRLLRDQWLLRQSAYRAYQRSVASSILLLVKSQPMLDSIRRLDGPPPDRLLALRTQLSGGAERLERVRTPDYLRGINDLLVGTWRFADNAVRARVKAIEGGDSTSAWEASSAAAGALMMLTRVQSEIRDLIEPPRLK
jgi:hypothetical protein